jgi:hypothetical protein
MKTWSRLLVLMFVAATLGLMSAGNAMAQIPEASFLRVTEPLDVGGTVLQPGVYVIRVLPLNDRNLLQVTSEDRSKVFATVLSIPHATPATEEQTNTEYVLYPATAGSPRVLRTWFAPHSSSGGGHDIVYSEQRAMELAALANDRVVAYKDVTNADDLKITPLEVVTADKAVEPYTEAAPAMKPMTMTSGSLLPGTASPLPLLALLGILMVGAAVGLRTFRSH